MTLKVPNAYDLQKLRELQQMAVDRGVDVAGRWVDEPDFVRGDMGRALHTTQLEES